MCSAIRARALDVAASPARRARIARCSAPSAAGCRAAQPSASGSGPSGRSAAVDLLRAWRCPRRRPDRAWKPRSPRRSRATSSVVGEPLPSASISACSRAKSVVAEPRNREADRQRLERLAHLVGVEELLCGQRAHDGAAARPDRDEPLGGEPADRLAQRPAADAERARERDLLSSVPGGAGSRGSPRADGRRRAARASGSRARAGRRAADLAVNGLRPFAFTPDRTRVRAARSSVDSLQLPYHAPRDSKESSHHGPTSVQRFRGNFDSTRGRRLRCRAPECVVMPS